MYNPRDREKPAIIGGVFGLEAGKSQDHPIPNFFERASLWTCNARSALYLLLLQKNIQTLWLPSYLCESLLRALPPTCQAKFYPLGEKLRADDLDWITHLQSDEAVLVIDYFGFAPDPKLLAALKAASAWIIEDASQAFLSSHVGSASDYTLFSPRKFIGVPDGGVIWGWGENLILKPQPSAVWQLSFEACLLRRAFDLGYGDQASWFLRYQRAEALQAVGDFASSEFSRTWLKTQIPYQDIAAQRRANYLILLDKLAPFALFPELPNDVVPLGFPIYLDKRNALQAALFQVQIFPAIHWALPPETQTFQASQNLSGRILTLPCDQRYNADDMHRISQFILQRA